MNPWTWQDEYGYVQANEVTGARRMLICSGQTSVDENGTRVHAGDMTAQAMKCLDNVETVLREGGFSLADVVKLDYFVTDVDAFFEASTAIGPRLVEAGCRAAGTLLGVTRFAFPELMIEVEVTAVGD